MKTKLIENIQALVKQHDYSDTHLDSVKVFYSQQSLNKHKVIYKNCIIIVGQGYKNLYLNDTKYTYDSDNYLIVPATLPLECETSATKQQPFLAVIIEIDLNILKSVINQSIEKSKEFNKNIIYTSNLNKDIEDITIRLLDTLKYQEKSDLFANNILKELYYSLLQDENGSVLYNLLDDNSSLYRIHQSLNYIYENLDKKLTIVDLADKAGMSVATYYRYFKNLTNKAPLQLVKETRLTKAKQLIEKQNYKANKAALEVGYQSYSQFSREFKRLFEQTPNNFK